MFFEQNRGFSLKIVVFSMEIVVFRCRPLPAARSRSPQLSKAIVFLMTLIENRACACVEHCDKQIPCAHVLHACLWTGRGGDVDVDGGGGDGGDGGGGGGGGHDRGGRCDDGGGGGGRGGW